jgi:iron complex outermembrane receptor protein
MAGSAAAQVETVIVTAEFREADVQDTPIAITAVNADMLEARSQTNIFQVAAQAPSVSLQPSGASVGPALTAFIRGIGQTDFNYALEPGVGVYIDDIYYPTLTGSLVDLLDLDRVEVLRGPQGTLAGKNSIGGAIKMYSKQPTGDGGGTVEVTMGSLNRIDVRGSADFQLADTLFARVAGVSRQRDGYVTRYDYGCVVPTSNVPLFGTSRISDCVMGTEGGQSYTAGRVILSWEPSDDFTATFSADITNDDSEAIPSVLIAVNEALTLPTLGGGTGPLVTPGTPGYPNANYPNDGYNGTYIIGQDGTPVYLTNAFVPYGTYRQSTTPFNDGYINFGTYMDPWATNPATHQRYSPSAIRPQTTLDHEGFSATFDWNFGDDMSLKWINSWRQYTASFSQDEDRTPINSQFLLQHLDHDQWSTELRLSGGSERFDYTTGIFWFEQDGTLEANVNLFYVQFNFIHGPDPTPSFNHAAFAHASFDLSDSMRISAGVRYSEDEKTYTHFRRNPDGTVPASACTATYVAPVPPIPIAYPNNVLNVSNCALFGLFNQGATFADERVDWRLAFDWNLGDDGDSMIYASASTGYKGGGINPRPFILAQLLPFNNEELTTYEIGWKSTMADGNGRLNMAVFYNDYTDIIMTLNPCFAATPDPTDGPGPCALPINAGSASVPGIEIEFEWHVGDKWLFDASASMMDFEYDVTVAPVRLTDKPTYTPETKWSVGIQYDISLDSGGYVGIRLDTAYQSEMFTLPLNAWTNEIEERTLSNLRLMWHSADELWESAIEVTNLTDEYYFHTLFDQYASGGGTLAGQPGLPMQYAVTLRRNF